MTVNFDEWREVVNGDGTYQQIACDLRERSAVIVGWTDGASTHYDVLFTLCPRQYGSLQGGLRGPSALFVSIMRRGCFGFSIADRELHPSYVAEKLGERPEQESCVALTALLTGVMRELSREALTPPS